MKGSRTYSFGAGREDFKKTVVNPENIEPSRENPPPNLYNPHKTLGAESVGFKLKYKLDFYDTARLAKKNNYPGAGTYEDQTSLNKTGSYVTSGLMSSKAAVWGKDQKLKPPGNKFYPTPGPGYHEHMGNTGDII